MTLRECYEKIGSDYDDAMSRIFDEGLLKSLTEMFLNDESYSKLSEAMAVEDWQNAFSAAHTLKGVAANLGFTKLYSSASAVTEALRGGTPQGDVQGLFLVAKKDYEETVAAVKEID